MQKIIEKLIVALDVGSLEKAGGLVEKLYPTVNIFKVGSQLFTACGPEVVRMITDRGAKVFLDLKFHDIPNTVKNAIQAAIKLNVYMLTVHTSGGREMLEAAMGVLNRPKIVGVTVLTSKQEDKAEEKVLDLAKLAKDSGLDGVVCSAHEASQVRKQCGEDFLIVTPGIRPADSQSNDQSRVAIPKAAVEAGANFIVVGRPIINAEDPHLEAKKIFQDLEVD